jgi:hypothetical protein
MLSCLNRVDYHFPERDPALACPILVQPASEKRGVSTLIHFYIFPIYLNRSKDEVPLFIVQLGYTQ